MRKRGDNNKPPFVHTLNGRKFAGEFEDDWCEITEDGSRIRNLKRSRNGEIVSAWPQNTTEPRRVQ